MPRSAYTLTTTEAAALIGCHPGQVRRLAKSGAIRSRRYSERLYLYDLVSVTAYASRAQVSGWRRGKSRTNADPNALAVE